MLYKCPANVCGICSGGSVCMGGYVWGKFVVCDGFGGMYGVFLLAGVGVCFSLCVCLCSIVSEILVIFSQFHLFSTLLYKYSTFSQSVPWIVLFFMIENLLVRLVVIRCFYTHNKTPLR